MTVTRKARCFALLITSIIFGCSSEDQVSIEPLPIEPLTGELGNTEIVPVIVDDDFDIDHISHIIEAFRNWEIASNTCEKQIEFQIVLDQMEFNNPLGITSAEIGEFFIGDTIEGGWIIGIYSYDLGISVCDCTNAIGFDVFASVVMHEIGHRLGLIHSTDGGVMSTYTTGSFEVTPSSQEQLCTILK